MIPALLIRMSSLSERDLNSSAAFLTDGNDAKSISMNETLPLGTLFLISAMAASALDGVRAARKISLGLCFASWRTVSFPSPVLPMFESGRRIQPEILL